jgi:hypothetical protein
MHPESVDPKDVAITGAASAEMLSIGRAIDAKSCGTCGGPADWKSLGGSIVVEDTNDFVTPALSPGASRLLQFESRQRNRRCGHLQETCLTKESFPQAGSEASTQDLSKLMNELGLRPCPTCSGPAGWQVLGSKMVSRHWGDFSDPKLPRSGTQILFLELTLKNSLCGHVHQAS